jgi:hypothetical protein
MPASDDLFAPGKGDSFARSLSGLAFSDREIQEMRKWIEDGDRALPHLVAALAESMIAASACMEPVRPSNVSWRRTSPSDALSAHDQKLDTLRSSLARLSTVASFPKVPFYERHFIPGGGMPSGLTPRDFDGTRNDENIYDEARAKAIKKALAAKNRALAAKKDAENEPASHTEQVARALNEYIGDLSAKTARKLRTRLADADFSEAAFAVIESAGHCIAAAAFQSADKLVEGEQLLSSSAGSDPDLRAIAIYYLENAREPVRSVMESMGRPLKGDKKALADLAKIRQRFGAASVANVSDKQSRRKNQA